MQGVKGLRRDRPKDAAFAVNNALETKITHSYYRLDGEGRRSCKSS